MKILTAIGNPILNEKLQKIEDIFVIGKDIQYQEGIIEILEEALDIECIIIKSNLPGEIGFYKLISKIKNIKPDIDIYVILEEKDEDLENYLIVQGIYKLYYLNEINLDEFIKNFEKTKIDILDGINREINEFKKLILNESIIENKNILEENNEEINEDFILEENEQDESKDCNTIAISGNFNSGKSLISCFLSKVISNQNKRTLLIDLDIENASINTLFGVKKYKENQKYVEDCIINIEENLDILCGLDKIVDFKEINNNYIVREIIERLKQEYDFIIIDVSSRIDFKYVKTILTFSDKIIFLIEPNVLEISKSNKILEVFLNDFNINIDKIKIVFNKSNKYQIAETVLEELFSEFEIVENIEYDEKYNMFINKNTNCDFEKMKFEKIYENLIMKEEEIYANSSIGSY